MANKANDVTEANETDEAEATEVCKEANKANCFIETIEACPLEYFLPIKSCVDRRGRNNQLGSGHNNQLRSSRNNQLGLDLEAAAAFDCTRAHTFSVAVVFNGATLTCACTFGFAIATVVDIEGKGKIEQFVVVFSSFCLITALPFTPSQNILQSTPKKRDNLEYLILDLNANAPGVL